VGLAETKNFAEGYDAIFGKKKPATPAKKPAGGTKSATARKKKKPARKK
jgi:hypothetical protein